MIVTDKTIRKAITSRLSRFRPQHDPIRLVEELELQQGAARIDMAFFGKDLLGVEIKSPRDSLVRLPEQARIYNRVFDRVVIVAAQSFVSKVIEMVPEWWGIIAIHHNERRLYFRALRAPERNPKVEVEAVVELLWKEELLRLLSNIGSGPIDARRPRTQLRLQVLETTDYEKIKVQSLEAFKARQNWRETVFDPVK